ncbi:MAG TPA: SCO family protein [Phenylobacterium sp.]|uniref:SCO family protein n=1 Tax=Phenylobacterium sp. TaxID=1871053 RepID=UPI002B4945E9|nr:SCO family protein [Phenylobacterium sp.]HKR90138.1 SCO family protein [Phenylobacterium sp.]
MAEPECVFDLIDFNGAPATPATYAGRHLLVFFGFTHCKVVCPRALSRISIALDLLGPDAEKIQPIYITVDPARDTPAVMKAFLSERYPRFIGLTGGAEAVEQARKAFKVFASIRRDPKDPDDYDVPHSALTYLIGPNGAYLAHFLDVIAAPELAERIHSILNAGA